MLLPSERDSLGAMLLGIQSLAGSASRAVLLIPVFHLHSLVDSAELAAWPTDRSSKHSPAAGWWCSKRLVCSFQGESPALRLAVRLTRDMPRLLSGSRLSVNNPDRGRAQRRRLDVLTSLFHRDILYRHRAPVMCTTRLGPQGCAFESTQGTDLPIRRWNRSVRLGRVTRSSFWNCSLRPAYFRNLSTARLRSLRRMAANIKATIR